MAQEVAGKYPLEDVVYGDQGESHVYRVADRSVPDVADSLAEKYKPLETSKRDEERMFLVYEGVLVQLMRDVKNPQDTLIEVSDKEFVRNHYDMSLLEAYLLVEIVDELFDIGYKTRKNRNRDYDGYITPGGRYSKSTNRGGSIRYGSVGGNNPRGGGVGFGK